jgi:hypothetical protein
MREYEFEKPKSTRRGFLAVCGISAAITTPLQATIANSSGELKVIKSGDPDAPAAHDVVIGQLYERLKVGGGIKPKFGYYSVFDGVGAYDEWQRNIWFGKIDAPEEFIVQRVGLVFTYRHDKVARDAFMDNHRIEVYIRQKSFYRSPLAFLKSAGNDNQAYVDLTPLPLLIHSQMSFNVMIHPREDFDMSTFPALEMWVVLDGFHNRGVC